MNKRPFNQKPKARHITADAYSRDASAVGVPSVDATSSPSTFSADEVANLLQISPEQLLQWQKTFPLFAESATYQTRYTQADLATLIIVQKLLAAGKNSEQIIQQLAPERAGPKIEAEPTAEAEPPRQEKSAPARERSAYDLGALSSFSQNGAPPSPVTENRVPRPNDVVEADMAENYVQQTSLPENVTNPSAFSQSSLSEVHQPVHPEEAGHKKESSDTTGPAEDPAEEALDLQQHLPAALPPGTLLGEMISTVASSQQSMLNVQDSIREMLGVIAQDNFNLKHENRKLRERMLELERMLSEHQRREETRKERLEGRLRAVENTLGAIQQQITQLVQLQRRKERRNWFR